MDSVHHIWCPLSSQEFQDLPDGAETTLTKKSMLFRKRLVRTVLIFTESSDQLSRATDRVP
ncbi:hypothetical protein FKJ82_25945, partial [Klebsiella pneumoniae]|nr:hypothetical protein [Klebsiella pneumoniae]